MRTAQKYFDMNKRRIDVGDELYWVKGEDFRKAINEARKEVIDEVLSLYVKDGNIQVWKDAIMGIRKQIK